jgi:lysophospholipase L1-like esterase
MKRLLAFVVFLIMIQSQILAQNAPGFWPDMVAFKKIDSAQKPALHSILFVGSSSFTKWQDVHAYFPEYSIINRGFGGSSLVDVIRYAYDIILPYQPKQVLIYCGENDLASSETISPEEVLLRVKTLVNIIRTNLPDATIDYVSIKPSPVRASIQDRVKIANKLIKAYFKKQKNAGFIDIYDAMLDPKGNMREELYLVDRLHMKPEGYAIWQKAIAPYLVK